MRFEDGTRAIKTVRASLVAYGDMAAARLMLQDIDEFRALVKDQGLQPEERALVLRQAIFLVENLFSHLPFKRARYAIDPLQQLRLLERQLPALGDYEFHERLLRIFASLRDVHTHYFLPDPYRQAAAFLPFRVEYFVETSDQQTRRRFRVKETTRAFDHPHFRAGAELLRWNGLSMADAIDVVSDMASGANESARFQRGLERLTMRPLLASLPPREEYVLVEYKSPEDKAEDEERGLLLSWTIARDDKDEATAPAAYGGVAVQRVFHQRFLDCVFQHQSDAGEQLCYQFSRGGVRNGAPPASHLRVAGSENLSFAWLRIRDFVLPADHTHDAAFDAFAARFRELLREANREASAGLVIDIRGNPGGDIVLAESLLQYLTPVDIEPARFALLQTPFVQDLAARLRGKEDASEARNWLPWVDDLLQAPLTGSPLSRGFSLSDRQTINAEGQIYQGPVLLLVDGLTYSAGDFFAAGFQDNRIGRILGSQRSTGGGGGNRWSHAELLAELSSASLQPLQPLPCNTQMGVALRRGLRAGVNQGKALEDLGVEADLVHEPTQRDLDEQDIDLLQEACRLLSEMRGYHLEVVNATIDATPTRRLLLQLHAAGIARVEVLLGNARSSWAQGAFEVPEGAELQDHMEREIDLRGLPDKLSFLQLRGYARNARGLLHLAAETRFPIAEGTG
jgi:hypothetical protein